MAALAFLGRGQRRIARGGGLAGAAVPRPRLRGAACVIAAWSW
jgi:hypothetical protein